MTDLTSQIISILSWNECQRLPHFRMCLYSFSMNLFYINYFENSKKRMIVFIIVNLFNFLKGSITAVPFIVFFPPHFFRNIYTVYTFFLLLNSETTEEAVNITPR